jgi:P4 family phage/plasmid primase-like protien
VSATSIPWAGREAIVVMDADMATNSNVHKAATELGQSLKTMFGASRVRFATIPVGGKNGLDDVLAGVADAERPAVFRRILDNAATTAGRRPKRSEGPWMAAGGPRVEVIVKDILAQHEVAVGADGDLLVYRDGYFQPEKQFLAMEMTNRLGDDFRPAHVSAVEQFMIARLTASGRVIMGVQHPGLLNLANGMLDPMTGSLVAHDPKFLSTVRWTIAWQPESRAPMYEKWMASQVGDQTDDLEEVTAAMLDTRRIPSKAILLYGPSRTGKSTYERLMKSVAGQRNTSALTLHQLVNDRFAPAGLFGMVLNCAADLSSRHIDDVSQFKALTGGDLVQAERKYGQPFAFVNCALFVFSANEIPSVSESSRAYEERVKPFRFDRTFIGREDPAIEEALMLELPGIFVRWVSALQRLRGRGQHLPTRHDVSEEFGQRSDRVKAFLSEWTVPDEKGITRNRLYSAYVEWATESGTKPFGKQRFYDGARSAGVGERKDRQHGACFLRVLRDPGDRGDGDSCDSFNPPSPTPEHFLSGNKERQQWSETVTTVTAPLVEILATTAAGTHGPFTHPLGGGNYLTSASVGAVTTPDMGDVIGALDRAAVIVGHGILSEDLIALSWGHGADFRRLAAKSRDTRVLARLANPPMSGDEKSSRAYELHTVASVSGVAGSPSKLPPGHSRKDDVSAIRELDARFPMTPYGAREHRLMTIVGEVRLSGFRVDECELDSQIARQEVRRRELTLDLTKYWVPATTVDGRIATNPLGTRAGKAAISLAFSNLGVTVPIKPRGDADLGKGTMRQIIERDGESSEAGKLASLVEEFNGQRFILQQIRENVVGGRVHAFIDASQSTGRWSIANPGLTTLRKESGPLTERALFLPEPGHAILTVDLAQIDARAVAAHCQDDAYMDLFEEGRDYHAEVAVAIFGDVGKRDIAKKLNHSVNYGAGASTLSEITGVSFSTAKSYLAGMANTYPGLARWKRDVADEASAGYLLDNGFGRKLRTDPSRASTVGTAHIGQSCARDLFMEGLLRVDDAGLTKYVRCLVHDELVLSVPLDTYHDIAAEVLRCFDFEWAPPHGKRAVHVYASLGNRPGANWADAYCK